VIVALKSSYHKSLNAKLNIIRQSIMITRIHSVSRLTSALGSKELAESHANKLLGLQTRTPINPSV
jgi:hypothetical protein